MKQRTYTFFLLSLVVVLSAVWLILAPGAQARPSQIGAAPAPTAMTPEYWKSGVTVEGSAAYTGVVGRLLSDSASFRSAASANAYYIFPAAGSAKTVTEARWMIVQRNGTYSGTATVALEIYSLDGVLQHTLTVSGVDLQTASIGAWNNFSLSSVADNLALNPGEYLGVHFSLSGTAGDNLDVRPIFEIILR